MPNAGPPGGRLPEAVIVRLRPYVDEGALRAARIRTSTPWRWIPGALRTGATTIRTNVCFREPYDDTTGRGLALIAHECVHVRQYREVGAFSFLVRYVAGAARVRFAHDRIPLEQEPLEVQRRVRAEIP